MSNSNRPRVYIARVTTYDGPQIREALKRAFKHVPLPLGANVLVESDWSGASPDLTPAASTRPEVVAGLVERLVRNDEKRQVMLSGRGALDVPARQAQRRAAGSGFYARRGFGGIRKLFGKQVRIQPGDESRLYRYQLSVGDALDPGQRRDIRRTLPPEERASQRVVAGWELYHAESLILTPKLRRCPELGGLAAAVGLLGQALLRPSDRDLGGQRVRDHRLADLLELADPDLVVTDAIEMGWGGGSVCQSARPLGLLIVADNAVAHDAVCARLLGLDPYELPYLVAAAARGYGTLDPDDVDLVSEQDLGEAALRVAGYGLAPPPEAQDFPAWYGELTRFSVPLEVLGGGPLAAGACARLRVWLMSCWDEPSTRESIKKWPPLSILVGVNEEGPRHDRVVLLGHRAEADFSRHCASQSVLLRVPPRLRSFVGGINALRRFRRRDGRVGWAISLDGDPPSLRNISRALWLFTLGQVRSPLLRVQTVTNSLGARLASLMRRSRVNRLGLPVVHARKIRRLQGRSWRRLWAHPAALAQRPTGALTGDYAPARGPTPDMPHDEDTE